MQSVLEQRFPHITTRLTEIWRDGPSACDYLDALLFKESARAERQGFTDDTWMELTFLNELLLVEYPPRPSTLATDVWAFVADASPAIA